MDTSDQDEMDNDIISSTPIRGGDDCESESPTRRRRMLPTRHGGSDNLYKQKDEDVIGHIKKLRRKLSNEHELNDIDIDIEDNIAKNEDLNRSVEMKDCNLSSEDKKKYHGIVPGSIDIGEMKIIPSGEETKGYSERGSSQVEDHDSHEFNEPLTPGGVDDQLSATESEADRMVTHHVEEDSKEVENMESSDIDDQKRQLKEILGDLAIPFAQQTANKTSGGRSRVGYINLLKFMSDYLCY